MKLRDMIRKSSTTGLATATAATVATPVGATQGFVANVASSKGSVENSEPRAGQDTPGNNTLLGKSSGHGGDFPVSHCPACGGGTWIRRTHESPWRCGRCAPAGPHAESIFIPHGPTPSGPLPEAPEFAIQPAAPNAQAVHWESCDGRIHGPAVPECLARDGSEFWISLTFEGRIWWINTDRLRSRRAFERQRAVIEFEPIL